MGSGANERAPSPKPENANRIDRICLFGTPAIAVILVLVSQVVYAQPDVDRHGADTHSPFNNTLGKHDQAAHPSTLPATTLHTWLPRQASSPQRCG